MMKSRDQLGRFLKGGNTGIDHWHWQGGRIRISCGYVLLRQPDHPNANINGYEFEHRLVMEEYIGRYLTPDEIIHHINGIKNDNRIENLRLMTRAEHMSLHKKLDMSDRVCITCNSATTFYHKSRDTYCWYSHPITGQKWICSKCYQKYKK